MPKLSGFFLPALAIVNQLEELLNLDFVQKSVFKRVHCSTSILTV